MELLKLAWVTSNIRIISPNLSNTGFSVIISENISSLNEIELRLYDLPLFRRSCFEVCFPLIGGSPADLILTFEEERARLQHTAWGVTEETSWLWWPVITASWFILLTIRKLMMFCACGCIINQHCIGVSLWNKLFLGNTYFSLITGSEWRFKGQVGPRRLSDFEGASVALEFENDVYFSSGYKMKSRLSRTEISPDSLNLFMIAWIVVDQISSFQFWLHVEECCWWTVGHLLTQSFTNWRTLRQCCLWTTEPFIPIPITSEPSKTFPVFSWPCPNSLHASNSQCVYICKESIQFISLKMTYFVFVQS